MFLLCFCFRNKIVKNKNVVNNDIPETYVVNNDIPATNVVNKVDNNNPELILFWAEWCRICEIYKPKWDKIKINLKKRFPKLKISEIECDDFSNCYINNNNKKTEIDGIPTIIIRFNNYDIEYNTDNDKNIKGNRTEDDISKFLSLHI